MRKTYSLTRSVLDACAPEQVEDAVEVLRVDSAAVILDLVADEGPASWPRITIRPRRAGSRYFAALSMRLPKICSRARRSPREIRRALDHEFRPRSVDLMAQAAMASGEEIPHVDGLGRQDPASFAGELEDGADEPIHLGRGAADEGDGFRQVLLHGDARLQSAMSGPWSSTALW